MTQRNEQIGIAKEEEKETVAQRIDAIGWALFLVMIGGLLLVPDGRVPSELWLIGLGVIMLGTSGVRYLCRIKVVGFTIALGIVALVGGISGTLGWDLPIFPIILILIGLHIIFKPVIKPLFKK